MLDLILLIFLLLLSFSIGKRLLEWLKVDAGSFLEQIIFNIGLGFAVLAYSIYLIGLLGILYRGVIWFYIAALTIVLIPGIKHLLVCIYQTGRNKLKSFKWKEHSFFTYLIAAFFLFHALLNLIGALVPETIFDAIWYHLALPKIYLAEHRVFFVPYVNYAAFPRTAEMLYTLAMGMNNDILAKLIHYNMGLLAAVAVYSFFRRYFSPRGGLFAAAIFYIMQPVNMLSQTAYIDLALVFYELLAVYSLANWWLPTYTKNYSDKQIPGHSNNSFSKHENAEGTATWNSKSKTGSDFGTRTTKKIRWLILAGVFAGIALGMKHQAVLLFATITFLLFLHFLFKERRLKVFLLNMLAYGVPAFFIALPWYLDGYLNTGNPFYPLFNTIFGTGESYEQAMFAGTGKASWYAGHSLLEYFILPWKFTMGNYEGWLSPLFLFFLPAIFFVKEKSHVLKLSLLFVWIFYTLYYAVVPFYTVRYFLPAAPILSLIAAFLLLQIFRKDKLLQILSVAVVLLTFTLNLGLLAFKTYPAATAALGLKDRDTYLSETLVWYDVNRFIREEISAEHKILVGGAPLFYYFDFNYVYGSVPKANSFYELAAKLKKQGFTHLLLLVGKLDGPEAVRYFKLVYSKEMPPAVRSNAARGAKLYEISE